MLIRLSNRGDLIGTDGPLRGDHNPQCEKPFVQADLRMLEGRAGFQRELPAVVIVGTFPARILLQEENPIATALRTAHNSIRPALREDVRAAVLSVAEEFDCLFVSLWVHGRFERSLRDVRQIWRLASCPLWWDTRQYFLERVYKLFSISAPRYDGQFQRL